MKINKPFIINIIELILLSTSGVFNLLGNLGHIKWVEVVVRHIYLYLYLL